MDGRENLEDAFVRSCARERELWGRIRGKHPGDPNCPEELWREWLKSAELLRVLATERATTCKPPQG